MDAADATGVWLMQGWLFLSSFWGDEQIAGYLSSNAVPDDRMVVLDLAAEAYPQWQKIRKASNKTVVWCLLHNYGGRRDLYGNLTAIASQPQLDYATMGSSAMVGLGITPEAIEQNPIVYELFLENAWRLEQPLSREQVEQWTQAYAARRYGIDSAEAREAWGQLVQSVYSDPSTANSLMVMAPNSAAWLSGQSLQHGAPSAPAAPGSGRGHAFALSRAWASLLEAARGDGVAVHGTPLSYDLTDLGRQVLSNAFEAAVTVFAAADSRCVTYADTFTITQGMDIDGNGYYYDEASSPDCGLYYGLPPCNTTALQQACIGSVAEGNGQCGGFNTNGWLKHTASSLSPAANTDSWVRDKKWTSADCVPSLRSVGAALLLVINATDELLAADVNYLVGTWLADAEQWASNDNETANLRSNAKNQITLWGPNGEITDYASKGWAGLVGSYYYSRWALYVQQQVDAALANQTFNTSQFAADDLALGQTWYQSPDTFPGAASGADVVAVGAAAQAHFAAPSISPQNPEFVTLPDTAAGSGTPVLVDLTASALPPGTLSWLCSAEPLCAAFDSAGRLLSSLDGTVPSTGACLYVKRAVG